MSGLPAQKARPHAPLRLLAIWAATSSLIGCAAPQEAAHPAGFTEAHSQERSHRHSAESLVGSVLASPLGKGEAPAATGPMAPSELDGPTCLAELGRTDVAFRPLEQLRGVETPVEIRGPIGPVTFWVNGGAPLRLDCRMALTLRRLAPRFAELGLTRARYSGAYVYRTTRTGRLSHHAHGLALDLHDLEIGGQLLSVKKDFARSVACEKAEQPLNRLACALREAHAFEELLTPDYNADHYDHLHLAVARGPLLRFERDQALAAAKEQHAALLRAARAIEEAKEKSGTSSAATAASMPTPAPAPATAAAAPATVAPATAPTTVAPTTAPATVTPTTAPTTSPPAPAEDAQPPAPTDEGAPPPPPPPLEDASVTVRVASAAA